MERRTNEGQMEYEWQNQQGPVDTTSPFIKHAHVHAMKRTHTDFTSPDKSNGFKLREPTSQKFFFSDLQPSPSKTSTPFKPLPAIPLHKNPAFNTPRKFEVNYDSSGPEASSPENNADSEATPDMGFRQKLARRTSAISKYFEGAMEESPKETEKRVVKASNKASRGVYSTKGEKRVFKRRKENQQKSINTSDSEVDSKKSKRTSYTGPGLIASTLGFIDTHPNLPHILSYYAQLILNFFLVFFFIYIIYTFWSTIRADVDKKSEEAIADIMVEMAKCMREYQDNQCDSKTRPPALEALCNNWYKCANRDPRAVGRARVSAHTFAEIFNSFIEPISYKAMIFFLITAIACFGSCNLAFNIFRNKSQHLQASQPPSTSMGHRYPSGPHDMNWNSYQPQTPHHLAHEPWASPGMIESPSPQRRLQY